MQKRSMKNMEVRQSYLHVPAHYPHFCSHRCRHRADGKKKIHAIIM